MFPAGQPRPPPQMTNAITVNKISALRQPLPFSPAISTRTAWIVAAASAPLLGLLMALADPPREKRPLSVESVTANWDVLTLLLLRLLISYGAARKAFMSPTRLRAVVWMAAGAALVVVLAPWQPHVSDTLPGYDRWARTRTSLVLAAAWYSFLAILLYRRTRRYSHEQADVA